MVRERERKEEWRRKGRGEGRGEEKGGWRLILYRERVEHGGKNGGIGYIIYITIIPIR